jgi:hypothetical protein
MRWQGDTHPTRALDRGVAMVAERRRRFDDGDDSDDSPVRPRRDNTPIMVGLILGAAVLVLFTCLCGVGIVAVVVWIPRGAQPNELVGSWKGRFFLRGQQLDVVYKLDKSGRFTEEEFDLQGRRVHTGGGRWFVRNGRLEILFDSGGFETADFVFVDNNTINYRIVNHAERAQIGLGTTFRRQ